MSQPLTTDRAMILAGGLGTRMQKDVDGVELDEATAKIADAGVKALIPIGRPFLDHAIEAMLDAGVRDFCLIVPPGASVLREYYEAVGADLDAVTISFAVQEAPLGTANAVAAGREWAGEKPFLVLNSDNFYTAETVAALAAAPAPASVAFERDALIAGSNIPAERIVRFAAMEMADDGRLLRVVEKPDRPDDYAHNGKLYVSMNCFLFDPSIFDACDAIEPNPIRNEYELPTAVQYEIDAGAAYHTVKIEAGVLDLTGRTDIGPVRKMLAEHEIRFPSPALDEAE